MYSTSKFKKTYLERHHKPLRARVYREISNNDLIGQDTQVFILFYFNIWKCCLDLPRSGSEQDVSGHFSGRSSEVKEPKRGFQNGKMNIFRLAGDMTHLASVLVLLLKIHTIKSCAGVSLKTQELYAMVFAARYLDIFTDYVSLYNTVMKLIFLGSSFSIVWYIRRHKIVRRSYDKDQDTFRHLFLILPCLLLALFINEKFTFKEVMWTFSIYLEAVAILPQLVLLQRTRNIDNLTGQYVLLLGAYRALYILNWIYRYFTEPHYVHWITWISGLVQTLLYADFFYYYFQSWKNNTKLELPA
nr:ER lumen protein-retaining receptor [Ipomoea batatas]